MSSYATQPVLEKCIPPLIIPPSQEEADENCLAGLTKLHVSQTGSVAYDDTYRVVAPPWMQALIIGCFLLDPPRQCNKDDEEGDDLQVAAADPVAL